MKKIINILLIILISCDCNAQAVKLQSNNGKLISVDYLLKIENNALSVDSSKLASYINTKIGNGGQSTGIYMGNSPTNITIGGLNAGTNIYNQSITSIIEKMLITYLNPVFSTFNILGLSTVMEVGTSITGSKTFAWTYTNPNNIIPNTLTITDLNTSTILINNGSNVSPTTYTLSITNLIPNTYSWSIQAQNTKDISFTSTFSVGWYLARYWGATANSIPINSEFLSNPSEFGPSVASKSKSSFNITITGGYKKIYFAIPTSYGLLSSIKVGGFESLTAFDRFTVNITNVNGIITPYYVYVSQNSFSVNVNDIIIN